MNSPVRVDEAIDLFEQDSINPMLSASDNSPDPGGKPSGTTDSGGKQPYTPETIS